MKKVQRMTLDPARCICCGKGNVPDGQTGEIGPFIDLEMEIGWNDHAYICMDCGAMVGALAGMITADEAKDFRRMLKKKNEEIHDLKAKEADLTHRLRGTQRRLLKVG